MSARTSVKPRKLPRQARARATVETILEAAAQVFQRHGYAAGTTDRIAERAGVSVGSLYQYFPNKDAILVALAERHIDAGFARLRAVLSDFSATSPTVDDALRGFVQAMIDLHIDEPKLHRVLFEEAPLPAGLRRELKRREAVFALEIATLLDMLPGVTVSNPALAAHLLVQIVEGLVHGFILHPPADIDTDAFVDEVIRLLRAYLVA